MSCSLVVYQLKSMMTTNTKYKLRENDIMLNGNNGVCFTLLMISHCQNTIAQDGYRSFKTVQLERGEDHQLMVNFVNNFSRSFYFYLLFCFAVEILFSSL